MSDFRFDESIYHTFGDAMDERREQALFTCILLLKTRFAGLSFTFTFRNPTDATS